MDEARLFFHRASSTHGTKRKPDASPASLSLIDLNVSKNPFVTVVLRKGLRYPTRVKDKGFGSSLRYFLLVWHS